MRGGPVHEVRERLVLHPRGHRAAAEARGRAAVGVDRRSAAKGVTDLYHEERPPVLGNLRRSPMHVGPRRPTSSARPFDGTTGGRGNAREPMDTRWPGSGGPATILYLFGAPARCPSSTRRGTPTGRSAPTGRSPAPMPSGLQVPPGGRSEKMRKPTCAKLASLLTSHAASSS
jgi:hypothetical protein